MYLNKKAMRLKRQHCFVETDVIDQLLKSANINADKDQIEKLYEILSGAIGPESFYVNVCVPVRAHLKSLDKFDKKTKENN